MKSIIIATGLILAIIGAGQILEIIFPRLAVRTETLNLDKWHCTNKRTEMIAAIPSKPLLKNSETVCYQWTRND